MTTSRQSTEFGLLGPVQALRDGVRLPIGGPRQRAVLVRLLLDPGRVVPADVLISDVWDGTPPATARKTLQKYVSELRSSLGSTVVLSAGGGYAVDVDRRSVDTHRFEELLAANDHDGALALWRGEALADLPDVLFAVAERARLDELRLVAVERHLAAALERGRHVEAAAQLAELARLHPMRERLCALFMLALYRSGRQVEALEAFTGHRRRLADELGIDPADELIALERAILRHDEGPDSPLRRARPHAAGNLQLPVSSFVGRESECGRVVESLRDSRLVTLIGPGGVGKTRLAVEAAARTAADYAGGVWLVDLAGLADPALVAHQVATTLSIGNQPHQDDDATVVSALEHRPGLVLLLDNCEHVIDGAAALVDSIVRTCEGTRVLATSRRPLGVDGERVLPVQSLPQPDACRLFTDRARLAGTTDEEAVGERIAEICRSLDGLPLAVELTAGQLRALGPSELAAHLDERLRFVSGRFDAPPRQRTLRAPGAEHCRRALGILRRREDTASVAHCVATLADVARLDGDPARALGLYETALDEFRLIGDRRCTSATYLNLAELARTRGDRGRSSDLARQAVRIRHQLGDHAGLAECLEALAADLTALGRDADATRLRTVLAAAAPRSRTTSRTWRRPWSSSWPSTGSRTWAPRCSDGRAQAPVGAGEVHGCRRRQVADGGQPVGLDRVGGRDDRGRLQPVDPAGHRGGDGGLQRGELQRRQVRRSRRGRCARRCRGRPPPRARRCGRGRSGRG